MCWYSHLPPTVVLLCCNLCAGKEIIVELFFHLFFCFFLALPESLVFPRASTALITAPKQMLSSPLVCPIYEAASTDAPSKRIRIFLIPQVFLFSDRLEYSRVDGSRSRKEKVADSKVSGYVCAGRESLIFLVNHSKSDSAREGRAGNPRRTRAERPEQEFPLCYNFSSFYHCMILVFRSPRVAQRK